MPRLHVVIASTRPGRTGPAVADWFTGIAEKHGGFDVHVVDLAEVGLPLLDEPHHPASGTTPTSTPRTGAPRSTPPTPSSSSPPSTTTASTPP